MKHRVLRDWVYYALIIAVFAVAILAGGLIDKF